VSNDHLFKWHTFGGRTFNQTRLYDLGVVKSFAPDMVILQVETKSVTALSAADIGSLIEDFAFLVYDLNGFRFICVCQTIHCKDTPSPTSLQQPGQHFNSLLESRLGTHSLCSIVAS